MKINNALSDQAVLTELGRRLALRRIALELSQADLARQAGVGKRTVERIESGESGQATSLVRILRVLDLLPALDGLMPEDSARPMALLKNEGRMPKRVRKSGKDETGSDGGHWQWDEPE